MKFLAPLVALVVGALLPLQALVNARLGQLTSGALFASLASFAVGTAALSLLWLGTRPAIAPGVLHAPWWAWSGGLIGAAFVVAATALVPRLGAAGLVCLVVFGQLAGSLLLDHFGVLHARAPIDGMRVGGVLLVALGALLVVKPWQPA
jgi:bacterial/archaeal transporter family-2 protein